VPKGKGEDHSHAATWFMSDISLTVPCIYLFVLLYVRTSGPASLFYIYIERVGPDQFCSGSSVHPGTILIKIPRGDRVRGGGGRGRSGRSGRSQCWLSVYYGGIHGPYGRVVGKVFTFFVG
jgi:hypothetical protein